MKILPLLVAAVVVAGHAPSATQQPNLTGIWVLEGFYGAGPLGFRNSRAVCELPADGVPAVSAPETPGHDQLQSIGNVEGELTISQSATHVMVERKYSGSIAGGTHKDTFKLDGAESATTVGPVKSTTRARWEAGALVVDHQLRWTAASKEVGCNVRETFSLTGPDTLSLRATNTGLERAPTANQTYLRKR